MPVIKIFYKVIYGEWCVDAAMRHCKTESERLQLLSMLVNWAERVNRYKGNRYTTDKECVQPLQAAQTFRLPERIWHFESEESD